MPLFTGHEKYPQRILRASRIDHELRRLALKVKRC